VPGLVLAIDPGTEESGWVIYDPVFHNVHSSAIAPNRDLVRYLRLGQNRWPSDFLAVEMIGHYGTGMAPGKEVYDTCVWIGRFVEAWEAATGIRAHLMLRNRVKLHLCGSARAKDPNIRAALIDKLGAPGTKKDPGPTYGIKSHLWAALGVAVAYSEGVR
jgi:hypothetical protein